MELHDFIDQLEQVITNAGSDKLWKRTVGGVELWFSPMTLPSSEKVNEVLTRTDLGPNVVIESKRVTLANSIVGMNGIDLRAYRGGQAVFPVQNKEGKIVKVQLEKYVYEKMSTWGGQFVDDAFAVYADLLEGHQKENLKEIRFENVKDPKLELLELEARAAELREQMGMPSMVEAGSPAAGTSPPVDDNGEKEEEISPSKADEGQDPDFDPFHPVRQDGVPKHVEEAEANVHRRRSPRQATPEAPPTPQVRPSIPVPSANLKSLDGPKTLEDELFDESARPATPRIPLPPVRAEEVLESPAERIQAPPPRIDVVPQVTNPRFSRPGR